MQLIRAAEIGATKVDFRVAIVQGQSLVVLRRHLNGYDRVDCTSPKNVIDPRSMRPRHRHIQCEVWPRGVVSGANTVCTIVMVDDFVSLQHSVHDYLSLPYRPNGAVLYQT